MAKILTRAKAWSEKDIQRLKQEYVKNQLTVAEIAKKWGRSRTAVYSQASKLKIKKSKMPFIRMRTCPICAKQFQVTLDNYRKKYCSSICCRRSRIKAPATRTCQNPNCGKAFEVYPPSRKKKYCSLKCASRMPRAGRKVRVKIQCRYCGKLFEVSPCYRNRLYCSKECRGKDITPLLSGLDIHKKWFSDNKNGRHIFRSLKLPDYMEILPNGQIRFIEVKVNTSRLNGMQKEIFGILTKLGIPILIHRYIDDKWVEERVELK